MTFEELLFYADDLGLDYAIFYKDTKSIDDEMFQSMRMEYILLTEKMMNYIEMKAKEETNQ